MAGLDRAAFAERLKANAAAPTAQPVKLPSGLELYVRKLPGSIQARVAGAASAGALANGGNIDLADAMGDSIVALVRWGVVDEVGEPLATSMAEAAAFLNTLDPPDFQELFIAVQRAQEGPRDEVDGVEVGKAS